jgi:acetyl esterase/lipase
MAATGHDDVAIEGESVMHDHLTRPPFDPEVEPALIELESELPTMTDEAIPELRVSYATPDVDAVLAERSVTRRDLTVPGLLGDGIMLTVLSKDGRTGGHPVIYHLHAGGGIVGDRFLGAEVLADWVEAYDAVVVTVDYRLAPEFPDPFPVEDAYAGLVWTAEHAGEIGVDPRRILLEGNSYGGGLVAGIALLARDRGGPALLGQLLMYPSLDDRLGSVSAKQYDDLEWDGGFNRIGWRALLGERQGTDDVSIFTAPARAEDLSGLPPAYLSCGSAEACRDACVAYATKLWEAGVQAELHVWAGGFHGFEGFAPDAKVTRALLHARDNWMMRMLS